MPILANPSATLADSFLEIGRFIFRMCDIYNNLPQVIVDAKSVNSFQHQLTQIVRRKCQDGQAEWALSFSRRSGPDV